VTQWHRAVGATSATRPVKVIGVRDYLGDKLFELATFTAN